MNLVNVLDVGSKGGYPAANLSNFSAHPFVFDGVDCGSMEGFLQSLKFDKEHIQKEVCKLVGVTAKHRGKDRNNAWKTNQKLWWLGNEYLRKGEEYQHLLDRAFIEMARQNSNFCTALLATNGKILTHHIGRSNQAETVLTQSEFCNRLMNLRTHLSKGDLSKVSKIS